MEITDFPKDEFRKLLYKVSDLICDLYTDIGEKQVYQYQSYDSVRALFREHLPTDPVEPELLIEKIRNHVISNVALHYSPHFYAWVTSSATQGSIIGDMVACALNVNATTWMNAPAASEIEQQVIEWIGDFINYKENATGVLLSGGSMANLTALKICLTNKASYDVDEVGINQTKPVIFYVSEQNHHSIDKAIRALGIGKNNLRKVKTNEDFTIDITALENQIQRDLVDQLHPLCIIGNAGTVNTGAVDHILGLARLSSKYDMWLHLDAAYGGAAAATDLRYSLFEGLELADSVTLDAHKWLFVPFECSCLLVSDAMHLKDSFGYSPAYQKFDHEVGKVDFSEYSLQQSRNFKALKVWMNFKMYGSNQIRSSIRKSLKLMDLLSELIEEAHDFELMAPQRLSVVCFRYIPTLKDSSNTDLDNLQKEIVKLMEREGKVFIRETELKDNIVLRACCTNFRREQEDVIFLISEIRRMAELLL